MTMNLAHMAERKAFEITLNSIIKKARNGEELSEVFGSLIDKMEKVLGDSWQPSSYEMLRKLACEPDSKWAHYTERILKEVDPHIVSTFALNAGYEGGFRGFKTSLEMSEKYDCNIPWIILMDPTTACNLHCTGCWAAEYGNKLNLTYEEMDKIVTEGKELGIHAYLFTGSRGTGKTTSAKIFARAVNCEHPVDGSPCGQCETCKHIGAGTSMNVIEIDAASNNGVDNIRDIIDEVSYSPTEGRYKVYIIDEVHMLSTGAFNALLKTLEEPPSYVIFILATTEVHKIPITILSRCQRYDFKRISIETITDRLKELMEKEQIAVTDKALRYIARTADGSMRDALSILDQCIAYHYGEENKLSVCINCFLSLSCSQHLAYDYSYGVTYGKEGNIKEIADCGEYIAACNCI